MASKVKIKIQSDDSNINLPSVSFGVIMTFIRIWLWSSKFIKSMDEETQQYLRENKSTIIRTVKEILKELKGYEPFTLVEVTSDDAYVLIDIR